MCRVVVIDLSRVVSADTEIQTRLKQFAVLSQTKLRLCQAICSLLCRCEAENTTATMKTGYACNLHYERGLGKRTRIGEYFKLSLLNDEFLCCKAIYLLGNEIVIFKLYIAHAFNEELQSVVP